MREALRGQTSEGKGLAEMRGFVDGKPGVVFLGVVYRSKARSPGFVLNVCPWCGAALRWSPEGHHGG